MSLSDQTEASIALIAQYIDEAKHPVAWASGGKDSLVLLHLMRHWAGRITILHTQLDDGWTGQTTNLLKRAVAWGYDGVQILRPKMDFPQYVEKYGWPVDIVPTAYEGGTAIPSPVAKEGPRMSSYIHCQLTRIVIPLVVGTTLHESTLVMTGSKAKDGSSFQKMGAAFDATASYGWVRINPLTDWSDEEVYDYVDEHVIELPEHYRYKRSSGSETEWSDCLSCTFNPDHWRLLKQHYPEEFAKRWPAAKPVFKHLSDELLSLGEDAKRLVEAGCNDPIRGHRP